jgi:hypothetical protein
MQHVEQAPCDAHDRAARRREILRGEVAFASMEEQTQRSAELLGAGALLVTVPPPTREARGRLAELLDDVVERELTRAGAPAPYLTAWAEMPDDMETRLAGQLFRARTVGATGLAIAFGSLRAIASPTLTPADSTTLRVLAEATRVAPLVLLIDDTDLFVLGYTAPRPLVELLAPAPPAATPSQPPETEPAIEAAREDDEPEPPVELTGDDATTNDTRVASTDLADATEAADVVAEHSLDHSLTLEHSLSLSEPLLRSEPAPVAAPVPVPVAESVPVAVTVTDSEPVAESEPVPVIVTEPEQPRPAPISQPAPPPPRPGARARYRDGSRAPIEHEHEHAKSARHATTGKAVVVREPDAWQRWAIALANARGAQPLAAFERLFTDSYVPLANAIASGLDNPRAVRAYDDFRRSFERSYTDAFATFGATNRRPRLVMDAYDVAAKQARLANARTTQVLVVDSMRFDLGCLIRDALAREVAGTATLVAEILLWSALPTTTMRQLETLARGLDALRSPAREEPAESLRGRAAEIVRRLRVGSRELFKLDLVPAMLDGSRGDVIASLPAVAEEAAAVLARHVSTLPARTLLFVVGDHGFSIDRRGQVQTGGASPEEVLVPAFAWLVGELH